MVFLFMRLHFSYWNECADSPNDLAITPGGVCTWHEVMITLSAVSKNATHTRGVRSKILGFKKNGAHE